LILIIAGKSVALVRDALIADRFGATYVADIYNFGIGIVYLFNYGKLWPYN
jgi:putative peptidoglycan lipid II flippase